MIGVIIWFLVSVICSMVFFVLSIGGALSAEDSFNACHQGGGWENIEKLTNLTILFITLLALFTLSSGISVTILWRLINSGS